MFSRINLPAKAVVFIRRISDLFMVILAILCGSISYVSSRIASALACGGERSGMIIVFFLAMILASAFFIIAWISKYFEECICFPR